MKNDLNIKKQEKSKIKIEKTKDDDKANRLYLVHICCKRTNSNCMGWYYLIHFYLTNASHTELKSHFFEYQHRRLNCFRAYLFLSARKHSSGFGITDIIAE